MFTSLRGQVRVLEDNFEVLGLGLGLESRVLGLGLEACVLDSITDDYWLKTAERGCYHV